MFGALVCSAGLVASCGAKHPAAPPSHAPLVPPIGTFDDTLVQGVGPGCLYERKPLPAGENSTSGSDASSLVRQYTRAWTAKLWWDEAANIRGTTVLTLAFSDISRLTDVTPRRDTAAGGAQEAPCEAHVELLGMLHVQTHDGRWNATFPAALQVQSSGATIVTISDKPPEFFAAPWSSSVDLAGHARLVSELTKAEAFGDLVLRTAGGEEQVAARWK